MALILDQIITSRLSLAVILLDGFKRVGEVVGKPNVTIQDLNLAAVVNLSGYHNFLDLAAGTYTINVKTDNYMEEEITGLTLPRNPVYTLPVGGWVQNGFTEATLSDISGLRDGDVLEFDNGLDPSEKRTITIDPDPTTLTVHWDSDPEGGLANDYYDTDTIRIPHPENLIIHVSLKPNPLYPFPSGTTLLRGNVHDTGGNPISHASVELAGGTLTTTTTENGDFVLHFPASQANAPIQITVTPPAAGGPPLTVNGEILKGRTTSVDITYP